MSGLISTSRDPGTFLEGERAQPADHIDHRVDVGWRSPAKPAQNGGDPKIGESRSSLRPDLTGSRSTRASCISFTSRPPAPTTRWGPNWPSTATPMMSSRGLRQHGLDQDPLAERGHGACGLCDRLRRRQIQDDAPHLRFVGHSRGGLECNRQSNPRRRRCRLSNRHDGASGHRDPHAHSSSLASASESRTSSPPTLRHRFEVAAVVALVR